MDLTYTYQSALGLDEGSILPVHLVVKSASVAQVVAGAVSPPQGRRRRSAVDAFATLFLFCLFFFLSHRKTRKKRENKIKLKIRRIEMRARRREHETTFNDGADAAIK